jgi:type II restriction enzyme
LVEELVHLEVYQKYFDVSNIDELVKLFQKKLTITNRTPDFFVNWKKVKQNVDEIKLELHLWNSLIGSENIELEFTSLITKYPEVIKTIPILLAIRDREFPIIVDFFNLKNGIKQLNFNKNKNSIIKDSELENYLNFVKNAGLFTLFSHINNFYDYVLGVEVGMDTNARKNRSGKAMELLLKPLIEQISQELSCNLFFQEKFKSVRLLTKVPRSLSNRKSDFIVFSDDKFVNIEVNYYEGAGSKPEEIVDSYINRKNELASNNWHFIWITDGNVWKGSESQLKNAFYELDYILNIELSRNGLLRECLSKIFN